MIDTFGRSPLWADSEAQERRAGLYWQLWYLALLSITGATALFMLFVMPVPVPLGALLFVGSLIAINYQPRYGLYLILFFALLGDALLMPRYPFTKNMSSAESLLYINGAVIFSPLELYLVIVAVIWLGQGVMQRKLKFYAGPLLWPALAFAGCLLFGLLYGIAMGGDLNIALWEVRPIFYLPLFLVLTSNLIETQKQVSRLLWVIMGAIFVESLFGAYYYFAILGMDLTGVERITEHSAAIHMNTLFVLLLAAWLYRASAWKRFLLPLMAPTVFLTYIVTQRRAAFLSLGIALVFMGILLYQQNRKRFWQIVPVASLLGLVYIGVFWNAGGALGLPAQAVKSVIAPEQNSADALSNLYRDIENINVNYTLHMSPLTGVGFGRKFHIIAQMPDISFFVWWEYIVHNSIFWIWMKTGVLGFLTMLFLVGYSLLRGARLIQTMPNGDLQAAALTATLYIAMHFLYAYVDMSWDNQSMLYVGVALGLINALDRIAAQPVPVPTRRWPWQPVPLPAK